MSAKDVLDEARETYLNDPLASNYTDTVLLPKLKTAYRYLESALQGIGAQLVNEEFTVTVKAGESEIIPPPDLVMPVLLMERQAGSSDEYRAMRMKWNIPQVTAGPYLEYWTWRTDRLYLLAATQDREVKCEYRRSFPVIVEAKSALVGKAETYLAAKTAALTEMFVSQSPTLAEIANQIAEGELEEILKDQAKHLQQAPIRRKPYIPFTR